MAIFTRVKSWVSNEVLTASDLNGEFNNLLTNTKPESIEDYSVDATTMRLTADPGTVGSESLAASLAGELERIRFAIKRIVGGAQWYSAPAYDLGTAIQTADIDNLAVTTAKINDLAVTTGKIADGAVTQAKRASLGQQVSSSCSNYTSAATSNTDVTNLSISITTTGRPVFVGLISDGSGNISNILINPTAGTTVIRTFFLFVRDASTVSEQELGHVVNTSGSTQAIRAPVSSLWHIETPAAGTYTYKLQIRNAADTGVGVNYAKLIAYEL